MKNQVLTAEQMRELIDMDIDIAKASMCWNYNDEQDRWALVTNFTHSPYIENEIVPAFTLQDILEMLPTIHLHHNINAVNENARWEMSISERNIIEHREFSKSILLVAFNMLKWCKENKYI